MTVTSPATTYATERLGSIALTQLSDREGMIQRTFDAPRDLVFEVCTSPEHLPHWYGPRRTKMVSCEVDFRVGCRYRYVLRTPDGSEQPFSGTYLEIVRPERVAQTWCWEPMADASTIERAEYEDLGGRTRLTVRVEFQSAEHMAGWRNSGAIEGMTETYDRLDDVIARELMHRDPATAETRELVTSRRMRAPQALVRAAFADRENIGSWWGPTGFTTTTYEMDVRPGGVWRYTMHGPDGTDYPNLVRYTSVADDRITWNHHADDEAVLHFEGSATIVALSETETEVTFRMMAPSVEAKLGMVKFGAVEGGRQNLARLAAYVEG